MKHLIIFAHPSEQSLNASIKDHLVSSLGGEHEVEIRDLNQMQFNPVLSQEDIAGQRRGEVAKDVQVEQQWVRWADCITFVYPIWWVGMPAILKGYIDRVFSYGFAYRYVEGQQQGLLTNKQVVIINTLGKSHQEYQTLGFDKAIALSVDSGIFSYCGLTVNAHLYLDRAERATAERVVGWKAEIETLYAPK